MFAAEYVERHSPSWKPSTLKATMSYLNSAILSAIGHLRVRAVVRADIACFFQEYRRRKPGGANRGHDILRNMFDCTNAWGHWPEATGNPFTGLVRYRFPPRGRSDEAQRRPPPPRSRRPESRHGGAAAPAYGMQAGRNTLRAVVRGQSDRLTLSHAKTGPRHVLLGEAARDLLVIPTVGV